MYTLKKVKQVHINNISEKIYKKALCLWQAGYFSKTCFGLLCLYFCIQTVKVVYAVISTLLNQGYQDGMDS